MTEHDVTGLGEVLIDCKPIWAAQRSSLPSSKLADLQGLGTQVLAIELQQVEGKQEHSTILPPVAQSVEARQAIAVTSNRFPIEQE